MRYFDLKGWNYSKQKVFIYIYILINNKGEQYTEKGLQQILFELVPDKYIGVNALRSVYI